MINNINWEVDWSQTSTQRGAVMLPLAIIAVGLIIADKLAAATLVIGLAQTIYSALGIAVSDKPKKE